MSTEQTAAALNEALRAFGENLGRALAEGIARGVQEGLSQSLDLDRLAKEDEASRPARSTTQAAPRRGGRPRGQARPCKIEGCPDPARSRGLCSRHYQRELRREKQQMAAAIQHNNAASVSARPPIVRRKPEGNDVEASAAESMAPRQEPSARVFAEMRREEPRPSPIDAAKRIFG